MNFLNSLKLKTVDTLNTENMSNKKSSQEVLILVVRKVLTTTLSSSSKLPSHCLTTIICYDKI